MKTLKRLLAAGLLLALPVTVWAADNGSVCTRDWVAGTRIKVYTATWVASATATKTDTTCEDVNGYLFYVRSEPNTSTAPADGWDLTITDSAGLNVMTGVGLANPLDDLDGEDNADFTPKPTGKYYGGRMVDGDLTLSYTEIATADADGEVFLYVYVPQ
jgi:hypothetical protein